MITLAELLSGIRALPAGKRKSMLDRAPKELLELFKDRVLHDQRDIPAWMQEPDNL